MEQSNTDKIIEQLSNFSLEEVQAISKAAYNECLRRIQQRRESCDHPKQHRGKIAVDRPPNIMGGCTYCVSVVRD